MKENTLWKPERDRLLKRVRQEFQNVDCPMQELQQLQGTGRLDEYELESLIQGVPEDWKDLSSEKIYFDMGTLSVFSPSMYPYFIAAYLSRALQDCTGDHDGNVDTLIMYIVYNQAGSDRDFIRDQQKMLTRGQRNVIAECLTFFCKYSIALDPRDDEFISLVSDIFQSGFYGEAFEDVPLKFGSL